MNYFDYFKLKETKGDSERKFDVDILIRNRESPDKFFALSVKGTSRKRINRYLFHLFMMDKKIIESKYSGAYTLEFVNRKMLAKYSFVCMDWAKGKAFTKFTNNGKLRKPSKPVELDMIKKISRHRRRYNSIEQFGKLGRCYEF